MILFVANGRSRQPEDFLCLVRVLLLCIRLVTFGRDFD